jgi:TonB-linked SusC/RagA family outer membrane protein
MRAWGKFLTLAAVAALCVAFTAPPAAAQQTGTVTGMVVDATSGRPLESAQVFLPALNMGGLSNNSGRFLLLNIPTGTHEFRVELIGYSPGTQQITVTAGQTLSVEFRLNSTALRLQELVVTGVAGETPRVKLPFVVEKVDFENMPVPAKDASGLLQAKVPGVKVVQGSGQPGNDASILLRGPTTITGSQTPLIIVDGVITDNTLADIGSLDVESIEIVKGAAAASLYGSRASNGVVQIRTKRGSGLRVDQSRITARTEYGKQGLTGTIPLSFQHPWAMSGGQIIDKDGVPVNLNDPDAAPALMCRTSAGVVPRGSANCRGSATAFQEGEYPSSLTLYDQVDEFFNPGGFLQNYVAVEGRTGSTNYRASFTHKNEEGIIPDFNDGADLKSFRLNLDHEVRDNLNVSLSTYFANSLQEDVPGGFFDLTFMAPFANLSARDPSTIGQPHCPANGCLFLNPDPLSNETNPLYPMDLIDQRDDRNRFLGSASMVFSPTTWFELEGNFSLDRQDYYQTNLTPKGYETDQSVSGGSYSKSAALENDINASLTASLNKAFGDLTTRTRIRYLLEDQHSESFSVTGREFAAVGVPSLDNTSGTPTAGSSISDVVSEGYFFITALDYQGKYVGDFLVRRDGSSLFGEKERWQTYFRTSAAWRLAQESWWPFDKIDEFKLRYSIATAGGRPGFSDQYETFSVSGGIITPQRLGNALLKPELATEQEIGLEMVLWNKISTGFTYATNRIEDQLLSVPLPGFYGYGSQVQNAGTLESTTYEAYFEAAVIDGPEMGWSTRVNVDQTTQEITELGRAPWRSGFTWVREGEELGAFYGHKWASSCAELPAGTDCSLFQTNDDGLIVYVGAGNSWMDGIAKDLWGTTGSVTSDSGDKSYKWGIPVTVDDPEEGTNLWIGSSTPDLNINWSNTFRYKNFNFYALFDGEFGRDIYSQTRQWAYREHRSADEDQAGKPDTHKKSIDYYAQLYDTNGYSGWFVDDGSYVKLRELSLRYIFDQSQVDRWFGSLGMDGMNINLTGRNVYTWTNFNGYDPEVGGTIGTADNYNYPNYRTITASLEVIF